MNRNGFSCADSLVRRSDSCKRLQPTREIFKKMRHLAKKHGFLPKSFCKVDFHAFVGKQHAATEVLLCLKQQRLLVGVSLGVMSENEVLCTRLGSHRCSLTGSAVSALLGKLGEFVGVGGFVINPRGLMKHAHEAWRKRRVTSSGIAGAGVGCCGGRAVWHGGAFGVDGVQA